MGSGIDSIIKTAQSPVVIFASKDIGKMSWAQIKQAAQDARSNPSQYYGYLGTSKKLKIPEYTLSYDSGQTQKFVERTYDIVLVDIAPEISVPGVGFVFLTKFYAPRYYSASTKSSGNTYYYELYPVVNYFNSKETLFFNNIKSYSENEGFVEGLMEIRCNAINKVTPSMNNSSGPFPLNIAGVGSVSGFCVNPSFLELFSADKYPLKDCLNEVDSTLKSNMGASFTVSDMCNNAYLQQCSMGYMKNVASVIIDGGFFSRSFDFRDLIIIQHYTLGSGSYVTNQYDGRLMNLQWQSGDIKKPLVGNGWRPGYSTSAGSNRPSLNFYSFSDMMFM